MSDLINITERDGQLLVTSLEVAENFGKRHDHALRDIDALKKDVPNFGEMFFESSQPDSYGRSRRIYYMNRDGFSLLVMGFSGKEARAWKVKYIQAFNEMERKLNDPMFMVRRSMAYLNERCNALLADNKALLEENAEMKPKASYYDTVLSCENALPITVIAKDYGWTGQKLNKYLHDKGVQYKQSKTWVLYKKYAEKYKDDNKLTDTRTLPTTGKDGTKSAHVHTYWTQKGRLFIYDLLKNDGILPTIEKDKGEQ